MEYEIVEREGQQCCTPNPSLTSPGTSFGQGLQRYARRAIHIPEEDVQRC